jgi:hypothetical protein
MAVTLSSYIPTAASALTRNVDALSFPFPARPQAMTIYLRGFYRGFQSDTSGTNPRIFAIGSVNVAPCLFINLSPAASFQIRSRTGTNLSSSPNITATVGDVMELLAVLNTNGSVQLTQVLNNGAASVGAASAATPLPQAWLVPTVFLNLSGNSGFDYLNLMMLAGVQPLATMRTRAGV